jgi:hypothetical protein
MEIKKEGKGENTNKRKQENERRDEIGDKGAGHFEGGEGSN